MSFILTITNKADYAYMLLGYFAEITIDNQNTKRKSGFGVIVYT